MDARNQNATFHSPQTSMVSARYIPGDKFRSREAAKKCARMEEKNDRNLEDMILKLSSELNNVSKSLLYTREHTVRVTSETTLLNCSGNLTVTSINGRVSKCVPAITTMR